MEAPSPFNTFITVDKPVNSIVDKPVNSIELKLKSDKNLNYNISIYYIEDRLFFCGIAKDNFQNKKFEKQYSLEEVKENKFFYLHESIKEVYDELDALIKNYKDINEVKLLEETNKLLIIFPLNTIKIKECIFEINELALSTEQKYHNIFTQLKEIQNKFLEENNLLKKEINELKERQDKSSKENNLLKNEINELKEKQEKSSKENNLLKNEIDELKEKQEKSSKENNLFKNEINELKEQNKVLKDQISKQVKIQSGEFNADFPSNTNHYMHCSTGFRSFKKYINFNEKYEKIPKVIVSIKGLDTNKDTNIRLYLKTENIDTSGFDLLVKTWDNTSIYGVKISWISIGY